MTDGVKYLISNYHTEPVCAVIEIVEALSLRIMPYKPVLNIISDICILSSEIRTKSVKNKKQATLTVYNIEWQARTASCYGNNNRASRLPAIPAMVCLLITNQRVQSV